MMPKILHQIWVDIPIFVNKVILMKKVLSYIYFQLIGLEIKDYHEHYCLLYVGHLLRTESFESWYILKRLKWVYGKKSFWWNTSNTVITKPEELILGWLVKRSFWFILLLLDEILFLQITCHWVISWSSK